jgi:hypothetical protein
MAAQCILKGKEIQADAFRQEDHVYRVLGQKWCFAHCLHDSRNNNKRRCLL